LDKSLTGEFYKMNELLTSNCLKTFSLFWIENLSTIETVCFKEEMDNDGKMKIDQYDLMILIIEFFNHLLIKCWSQQTGTVRIIQG